MAAIPTPGEEDARRPNRERENLIGQQTRIVNRIKACLARWGIRNLKPTLRQAAERLETLRTPEGKALPPRCARTWRGCLVREQTREIEASRERRLEQASENESHAMIRPLARVVGVGIETADMLVHEILSR
jgi:transposase